MIRGSEKVIGTVDGFHPLPVSFWVEEGYPALRQVVVLPVTASKKL
ncbi:hypothetical protein FXV91_10440 [Methanosarcina sp. DH2]|nr:hypothetical protein [Methanosarcina sp. DH2]MCC4770588.1 hypothetical protein [Methanosarcina sp. DH2]